MKRHLVIAPHPDDETLGCGGTLLRARAEGDEIYWLIVTGVSEAQGFSADRVASRAAEIDQVFANVRAFFGDFTEEALEQSGFLIDRLVELSAGRSSP